MTDKRFALLLLAAVASLAPLPGAAAARSRRVVEAPKRTTEFSLPATHGYRLRFDSIVVKPGLPTHDFLTATKGRSSQISYETRDLSHGDEGVDARYPGIGTVAVHFHQTSVSREPTAENCKGAPAVVRHGTFLGRIDFHGERDYTSADRQAAPGRIPESAKQVCHEPSPRHAGPRDSGSSGHGLEALDTGLEGQNGLGLGLSALRIDLGGRFGESADFTAHSFQREKGFSVFRSVSAVGEPADFAVSPSGAEAPTVTLAPPAPFHGSATFQLTSPTTSTWTGDLGVEIPGLGEVPLAGSEFWSAYCTEAGCTKTLPPGVRVGFVRLS
jgi:hypothetical protein